MKIIGLLILFGGITLFEAPGLIYRKYWGELLVFFTLLAVAFLFSILAVLGYPIPSPARGIQIIVEFFMQIFIK